MQLSFPSAYKDEPAEKMFHQKSFNFFDVFQGKKMPINGPKMRPMPV